MFGNLFSGGLLGGLLGLLFGKPPKPAAPVVQQAPETPQVDEAIQSESDRRSRRRRLAEGGRASTFLSGGVSDVGTVRRASDTLRPFGAN